MEWNYSTLLGDDSRKFEPEDVSKLFGFIYMILYRDKEGKCYDYIGKKQMNSYLEIDALKSGEPRPNHIKFVNRNRKGKRTKREVICKESNWRDYTGSCKDERVKGMELVNKEILEVVEHSEKAKTTLSYLEENYLHKEDVLMDRYNLNGNLAGKYFAGKIKGDKMDSDELRDEPDE